MPTYMLSHDYVAEGFGKFWTAGQIIGNNNMPRCYGWQPALAYRLIISCEKRRPELGMMLNLVIIAK